MLPNAAQLLGSDGDDNQEDASRNVRDHNNSSDACSCDGDTMIMFLSPVVRRYCYVMVCCIVAISAYAYHPGCHLS